VSDTDMNTVKKKRLGFFEEIQYYWVHSRPHTKRVRTRMGLVYLCFGAIRVSDYELHSLEWLWLTLSIPVVIYAVYSFLRYLCEDIGWEARQKDEQLSKLLTSSDLHQRFSALRLRLRGGDAEELSRLQDAMESGAREAQRLANEIEKYESATVAIREQQARDRQSAEALAKLLNFQGERLAEIIERKSRAKQWLLLVVGAIVGVIFQAIAQWVF